MKVLCDRKPTPCNDNCPCASRISYPIKEYYGRGPDDYDTVGVKTVKNECTLTGISLSDNSYGSCPLEEINVK